MEFVRAVCRTLFVKRIAFGGMYLASVLVWANPPEIPWAKIQGTHRVQLQFSTPPDSQTVTALTLYPPVTIRSRKIQGDRVELGTETPLRLDTHYYAVFPDGTKKFLQPDGILDSLYSDKPLGAHRKGGKLAFRVFAPRARWVRLVLFDRHDQKSGKEFPMRRDADGVWEYFTAEDWRGKYYGYRVWGPTGEGEMFDSTLVLADPYSRAVVTYNHYTHPGKTLILPQDHFSWEGDTFLVIPHRDVIIYEMHIRDMTAHPSSGVPDSLRGTYPGLVYPEQRGGLPYIRRLGVNAVELLPAQDFGNIEVPYRDSTATVFNTWNPYERNHWGYMTSYFFAPESYYATGGTLEPGAYNGIDGRQVREFKEMVKAFHRQGIAVLMDVVYNHVSQYDYNPLKYIDKFYYFRLKPNCEFESVSGCGNDLKTERPMTRRLIIDSVTYWMRAYHIDGFRFDLANMIDRETCREILRAARAINPHVILIAEPWGGGYDPAGFSDLDWASWNDQFRNGFKGWHPDGEVGFIFGGWFPGNNRRSLQRYVMGSLRQFGGQYRKVEHSVNYLESHDDHTLGDFIRLALGEVSPRQRIADVNAHVRLTPRQMRVNRLAALALLTGQGMVMLHEGQEFARSKVIAPTAAPDTNAGCIDHNSYEKDNATNWLNFDHAEINRELVEYYRGLIALRKRFPALRRATPEQFHFPHTEDSLFLVYRLEYDREMFFVALNGNAREAHPLVLPGGRWEILADGEGVYLHDPPALTQPVVPVPPTAGVILRRIR
ncbi:MAG: DUF3459 domain-containing protein [Calditrichaeota bacterium]|nr:MAG: DUF3459 domain-containing protein [Calditrichota bacterium]